MAIPRIMDRADEFRIEIVGRFRGEIVNDVAKQWQQALLEKVPRRYTIDISRMTSYDGPGRDLLRRMHQHGTQVAAATRRSLEFLREITARTLSPVLVPGNRQPSSTIQQPPELRFRAKAVGQ